MPMCEFHWLNKLVVSYLSPPDSSTHSLRAGNKTKEIVFMQLGASINMPCSLLQLHNYRRPSMEFSLGVDQSSKETR